MSRLERESGHSPELVPSIGLLRKMKPEDIAQVTGGKLVTRKRFLWTRIPWEIALEGESSILWAGYPRKQAGVMEMTPFLKQDRRTGATLLYDAVIIKDGEFIVVHQYNATSVRGWRISEGKVSWFEVPESMASSELLEANRVALNSGTCGRKPR